jgi:hypothetical protein
MEGSLQTGKETKSEGQKWQGYSQECDNPVFFTCYWKNPKRIEKQDPKLNLKEMIGGVKKGKGPLEKSGKFIVRQREEETIERKSTVGQSEMRS